MKTSELARLVKNEVLVNLENRERYLCNILHVYRINNPEYVQVADNIIYRVQEYIRHRCTFTKYLHEATEGKSPATLHDPLPLPHGKIRMVNFLRAMLMENIAKEFEAKGD